MLLLLACVATNPSAQPAGDPGLRFALPLADPAAFVTPVVGLDHDPTVYTGAERLICRNYDGRSFPYCYDEHGGSDFLLDGGFDAMDAGSQPVLAAAEGVVLEVVDGNYDRCHGDFASGGVTCDGNPIEANLVALEHDGGLDGPIQSSYLHLMSGSVAVAVGQAVACGEVLGLVGSSGNSSAPHLHFGVVDASGADVDPYAGPESQERTWWRDQGDLDGLPATGCP